LLTKKVLAASAAVLAAVSVLVSPSMTASGAPLSSAATSGGCDPVWFIGARGSGEPESGYDGMGPAVDHMASVIYADLAAKGMAMARIHDPYSADSVDDLKPNAAVQALLAAGELAAAAREYIDTSVGKYDASMTQGIKDAESQVGTLLASCPDAKIIMAGYSQGAVAVHDAENWLAENKPGEFSHIAGTLLLGDPDRVPQTKAKLFGTSAAGAEGLRVYLCLFKYLCLIKPHDVPAPATTANIANAGDIVGDFALSHLTQFPADVAVHLKYAHVVKGKMTYEPVLESAANWVASKIPGPGAAVLPGAGPPGSTVTVSGIAFQPHQIVTVNDVTGIPEKICSGTVAAYGNFHCTGKIPHAASYAPQRIVAVGNASPEHAATVFDVIANARYAYVADGAPEVLPIDTSSNSAVTAIPTGPGGTTPAGIAITPDGATAYLTNTQNGTVTPVNLVTGRAGSPVPVGKDPEGIAITPNGATAYVTAVLSGTVTPIRIADNSAGKPVMGANGGVGNDGIAITPNGKTAYVTNFISDTVTPIDLATNVFGKPIPVGHAPENVAITPNGATAYVVNQGSDTVTPVSTATNTPGKPIRVGAGPFGIAITPNGTTAYVTNMESGTVTPISTATNTAGRAIPVGEGPAAIAITPSGATAYVVNTVDGIIPVSTRTNTAGTPIADENGPQGVATTYDGSY
jgi:YVTN family beta-propeller protein